MHTPDYKECLAHCGGGGGRLKNWIKSTYPEFFESLHITPSTIFTQTVYNILKGPGTCAKCGRPTKYLGFREGYHKYCSVRCRNLAFGTDKKIPVSVFVEKSKAIHGGKYDYSEVEYKDAHTNVCIICPVHGPFWQSPCSHLQGCGCPRCAGRYVGPLKEHAVQFAERSRAVHGNRYIYDKVEYRNSYTKVEIVCPIHGSFFQEPIVHLHGPGCPECAGCAKGTTASFVKKARAVHGGRYIYDKVEYKNNRAKVCITCPTHGDFWQRPWDHLNGQGCPKCKQSKLEAATEVVLDSLGVKYIYQYHPEWMSPQSLDFYLPDYNLAIECQGIQHYRPVEFFGGAEGFEDCQKRDALKARKCKDNGIRLIYIQHDQDPRAVLGGLLDPPKTTCISNDLHNRDVSAAYHVPQLLKMRFRTKSPSKQKSLI